MSSHPNSVLFAPETMTQKPTEGSVEGQIDRVPGGVVLRLRIVLSTEIFEDGQSSSTLLIYFRGVLGISADGSTFMRARNYTPKLSGIIYCIRLLVLVSTLPRSAHDYIGLDARPRQ